jgi:hypothetical protein
LNKTGYTDDEDYGKIIKLSFNQKVKKALPHPKCIWQSKNAINGNQK